MNRVDSSPHLITEAQLFGWRLRVREIEEELKTLASEREKLQELIAMAQKLSETAELLAAARGKSSSSPKYMDEALRDLASNDAFPKAVLAVVSRAEDGATYQDIRDALLSSPVGARLRKSDKGFYHALRRFKDSEELLEYKGYVFTPENLASFKRKVEAGLKDDKSINRARGSGMTTLIYETIAQNPGMIARDVIKQIRKLDPELDAKLSQNDGSAYNAIARLKGRGEVVGRGHLDRELYIGDSAPAEILKLAAQTRALRAHKNEAPNGLAAGASDADEAATSSNDAQSVFRLIG